MRRLVLVLSAFAIGLAGIAVAPPSSAAGTVPGQPGVATLVPGATVLAADWTAATDGGSPVTAYQVLAYPAAVNGTPVRNCQTTGALLCRVTGLANGTTYYVSVRAKNANGWGAESARIAATPVALPALPSAVHVVPGTTVLAIDWTAAVSTSAAPVTGYQAIAWTAASGGTIVRNCQTTTEVVCRLTGLVNGTTYHVAVRAQNLSGWGAQTARIAGTPVTVPGTPRTVTRTGALNSVAVSWLAPSIVTAAAPVTGYQAIAFAAAGSGVAGTVIGSCETAGLSCTIPGLTGGTGYYVSVRARNLAPAWGATTTRTLVSALQGFTLAEISGHATPTDCWTAIDSKVYDVSGFAPDHPGGPEVIDLLCGVDGSADFGGWHGLPPVGAAGSTLAAYLIGALA